MTRGRSIKQRMLSHFEAHPELKEQYSYVYRDLRHRGSGSLPNRYLRLAEEWGVR